MLTLNREENHLLLYMIYNPMSNMQSTKYTSYVAIQNLSSGIPKTIIVNNGLFSSEMYEPMCNG
jgi:hypothetical protein